MKNCSNCGHRFEDYCLLSGEYFTTERKRLGRCNVEFSGWIPDVDQEELDRIKSEWNSLIMSVSSKFPNETIFETALRYIREREHEMSLSLLPKTQVSITNTNGSTKSTTNPSGTIS